MVKTLLDAGFDKNAISEVFENFLIRVEDGVFHLNCGDEFNTVPRRVNPFTEKVAVCDCTKMAFDLNESTLVGLQGIADRISNFKNIPANFSSLKEAKRYLSVLHSSTLFVNGLSDALKPWGKEHASKAMMKIISAFKGSHQLRQEVLLEAYAASYNRWSKNSLGLMRSTNIIPAAQLTAKEKKAVGGFESLYRLWSVLRSDENEVSLDSVVREVVFSSSPSSSKTYREDLRSGLEKVFESFDREASSKIDGLLSLDASHLMFASWGAFDVEFLLFAQDVSFDQHYILTLFNEEAVKLLYAAHPPRQRNGTKISVEAKPSVGVMNLQSIFEITNQLINDGQDERTALTLAAEL